VIIEICWLWG